MAAHLHVAVDPGADPVLAVLAGSAAHALRRFGAGATVHVPHSRVIHAMRPTKGLGGVLVPGLACNTAVGGWDWTRLEPSRDPVSCVRCRSIVAARYAPHRQFVGGQLALDLTLPA